MKKFFLTLCLAVSTANSALASDDFGFTTEELIDAAVSQCRSRQVSEETAELIATELLEIEQSSGAPARYRGLILARACREAGFSASAIGDSGKAVGIMQFHPWVEALGVDRTSVISSVKFHFTRLVQQMLPKIEKKCGFKTYEEKWIAAWTRNIRGPGAATCSSTPGELKTLERWQHWIMSNRATAKGE